MNILHYLDSLNAGGIETSVLDLYRNASKNGLRMTVASGGGMLEEDYKKANAANYISCHRNFPIDPRVILRLRKIVAQKKIKIIHVHNPVAAVHAYLASRLTDVKIIFSHHSYDDMDNYKDGLVRLYLMKAVDANIFVSHDLMEDYRAKYRFLKQYFVIGSGIDCRRLNVNKKVNIREELGIGRDEILLGVIGNFSGRVRDQMTICRVIPQIIKSNPRVHFLFVGGVAGNGDRTYYNRCFSYCVKNNIMNNVHFLGIRKDIPQILANIQLLVHSSNRDTQSITILEALAVGLPVVLSDIPSLKEYYGKCDSAIFFKAGNRKELIDTLRMALNNRSRNKKSYRTTRRWIMRNFGINIYVKKLKSLYASLM